MTVGEFRDEELLADVICRLIGDVRHIAVGAQSPIPATAALLAREGPNPNNSASRPYVSLLGSRDQTFFTDGARELFDCAGQGRVDVFFLSGGQIDGQGNINLVSVGEYEHPKARFPGSFGSAYLYYVVPKVILFRTEHSRRTLVPKVDFVSAPGGSPGNVARSGGPIALVTNRCVFDFDRDRARFRLANVHPGHSVDEVTENTGFEFDRPADVPTTPAPSAETLHLMRTVVAPMLAEVYPEFAKRVFGVTPSPRVRPAYARSASFGGSESAEAREREGGGEGWGEGASPPGSESRRGPLTLASLDLVTHESPHRLEWPARWRARDRSDRGTPSPWESEGPCLPFH